MPRKPRKITAANPSLHMRFQFRSRRLSSSDLCAIANQKCGELESFKDYIGTDWLSPRHLGKLIELASYDIHGMLSLRVDGDCFCPPECWCTLGGWGGVHKGAGGTPNEAVLRAMIIRDARLNRLPAGVERVEWKDLVNADWGSDKPINEDAT